MHLQPFCPLQPLPASCTPLCSTPRCSKLPNATTMFMIKSYLQLLKPSHVGNTISKVLVCQSTLLLTTRTFSTFPPLKSSCIDKHIGQNFFLPSTSLYISVPENWEPNPTLLLDDGTSTLKKGIVTMPLSTHRTTDLCSLPSTWCRPFELLPLLFPSYEDHCSWTLKGSIRISSLTYEMIPLPQTTSTTSHSQIPSGLSIQTVYYDIPDAYTSWKLGIYNYMFFSTCTTIPSQDFGQTKTLHAVCMQYYWPGLQTYVKDYCKSCTTCSRTKPVCH